MFGEARGETTFMQRYILPAKAVIEKPYDRLCKQLDYNRRLGF